MTRIDIAATAAASLFVFAMVITAYDTGRQQTTIRLRTSCDADKFDLKPEFYQEIRETTP